MNLSRRAKLDREAPNKGTPRTPKPPVAAEPAVAEPLPVAPIAPEPVAVEPETVQAPEAVPTPRRADEEIPKRTRYVREAAEKKSGAKPAPLPPRSTKQTGKLMSKNLKSAPTGHAPGGVPRKGPPGGREPIINTPKQ
jgi:hypothetical protein